MPPGFATVSFAPVRTIRPSALLVTLAVASCSDNEITRPGWTEIRTQNPPTEVDILLVVDDSGSMSDEQQKLSEGFEDFVVFFDVADVDYHIGVVTTDMDTDPGLLKEAGGVRVIDRDTEDAADVFADLVRVGVTGSGYERGIDAAQAALSQAMLDGPNAGFFREEALLSVIFVSDEEDGSIGPINARINSLRELKGQRRRDAFNASALVGIDPDTGLPDTCGQTGDPGLGAVAGWRYWDMAHQTGGISASICADEFTDIVSRMGLASSRLLDRFPLEHRPDLETVELTMYVPGTPEFDGEGLRIPPEGLDGRWPWAFEEPEGVPTIRFTDLDSLPPVATRIVIRYMGD